MPDRVTAQSPTPTSSSGSARIDRSLTDELRRITLLQYDSLIETLSSLNDVDDDIHSARKAMKRIRALLRLDREAHRREARRRENVTLRDVARRIAPVRDAFMTIRTFDLVTSALPSGHDTAAISAIRNHLTASHLHERNVVQHDHRLRLEIVDELSAARHRVALMPPVGTGRDTKVSDFDMLSEGLRRTYRSAQRSYRRAITHSDVGSFHRWRKPVKYSRHQLTLLRSFRPDTIDPMIEQLSNLGDILGYEQDLGVLDTAISAGPIEIDGDPVLTALFEIIDRDRLERQGQALELGREVYIDTPDDFTARLRRDWVTGRYRST
ncbi:MAG: CHAD domain-containing protein [Actinomycetota bacterium]